MGTRRYGALVHGRRTDTDAAATVEARTLGSTRVVLLAAVQGDLATPALESVKSAFARLTALDDAAAGALVTAAPPPPYAAGVAIVLLGDDHAYVAASGAARCHRERDGQLEELGAGAHSLHPGDAVLASSHGTLAVGRPFFAGRATPDDADASFRNDLLDAALETALVDHAFVAVAAAGPR